MRIENITAAKMRQVRWVVWLPCGDRALGSQRWGSLFIPNGRNPLGIAVGGRG